MQENIEPTHETVKTGKNWLLIILVLVCLLWLITLVLLGYLLVENSRLKKPASVSITEGEFSATPVPTSIPSPESDIVSQDPSWNLYTNYKLGFSMLIPKNMYHGYGQCEWKGSENSFRPKMAQVPVEVFEENNYAYITSEYYYELAGERVSENTSTYSLCNKIDNSLEKLADTNQFQQQKWKIVSSKVSNDQELNRFIQDNYGSGCKIGVKKLTSQSDVFDITLESVTKKPGVNNSNELEDLSCPINYMYYLKYSPTRERAISWVFGQSYTFFKDTKYNQYDEEMVKSFKMLD